MCIPVTSPLGTIIAVLQMGRDVTSVPYQTVRQLYFIYMFHNVHGV